MFVINVREPLIDEERLSSGSNMLALDNANGGIYDIENFAELPDEFEQYVLQKRFNFIPAYSSLDAGSGNATINPSDLSKVYNPLLPPPAPKNIPFDNFFTNPIISEAHIQFTLNNGNWLVAELSNSPEVESCAFACSNTPMSITGDDFLCNGNTRSYSLPQGGENYTWQIVSGNNLATINNSNGHVISVIANSNSDLSGNIVLRGTIASNRCNFNESFQKTIYIGKPKAYTRYQDPTICANVFLQDPFYTLPVSPGATSYRLTSNSPHLFVENIVFPETEIFMTSTRAGNFTITLTTSNSCGTSTATIYVKSENCWGGGGGFFSAYPNPVSNTLTIQNMQTANTLNATKTESNSISSFSRSNNKATLRNNNTFDLYDFRGNVLLSGFLNDITNIDVSKFKKGRYVLKINANGEEEMHHIVIK